MHLLLLHGALGSKQQFEQWSALLSERFEIHTLNFSGHGGEAFNDEFSIEQFAGEVIAYLDKNNISGPAIFGYSMGGYVAMYIAKHFPERVNTIITLATKFAWSEATAAKEIKMLDPEMMEQKIPAFTKQLHSRHAPNDWKELVNKTASMMKHMGDQPPLSIPDYHVIQHPSLLLLGDMDKMVTKEETIDVSAALPHAKFQLLNNTPHPFEQVDQELLAGIIKEYVSG